MARGRDVRGKIRRVTSIDVLDDAAVDGIAALCRRSLADPPTAEELAAVLSGEIPVSAWSPPAKAAATAS